MAKHVPHNESSVPPAQSILLSARRSPSVSTYTRQRSRTATGWSLTAPTVPLENIMAFIEIAYWPLSGPHHE